MSRAGRPRGHARSGARQPARAAAGLFMAVALGGCGVTDTGPSSAGDPAQGAQGARGAGSAAPLRLYYLTQNGTWPTARTAPPRAGANGAQTAMNALLAGPTRAERERGLATRLPKGRVRAEAAAGTVDLYLPWLVSELETVAVSQLVCTAAAAPGIPGGKDPLDVVVRVHESGISGGPWDVRCDETGSAEPLGSRHRSDGREQGNDESDDQDETRMRTGREGE